MSKHCSGYWYPAKVTKIFKFRGSWYCFLTWDDKDKTDRVKLFSEVKKDQPLQEVDGDSEVKPRPVGEGGSTSRPRS